jgi:hypothetical protein
LLTGLLLLAATSCKKTNVIPATENRLSTADAQNAAIVVHNTQRINDESYNWNPCTEELIHFTGEALATSNFIINGNKISGEIHYNPQGEKGEGLSSGIRYQGVGSTNESFSGSLTNGSYAYNATVRITFVAPGKGNNFVWTAVYHNTFNANGDFIVERSDFSLECQ